MKGIKKCLSLLLPSILVFTQAMIAAPATASAASLPDLVVTDVVWSPSSPGTGDGITFSATVKNQGTAATPSGTIVGCQFQVDGTEVSWSDTDMASLAPGASVTLTANSSPSGSARWAATNGIHTILAWVNDVRRFSESDTNNNQFTKGLTIGSSGLPDLIVTGISASPAAPNTGDAVTFSATVKNQGSAATPAGTVVGCQFQVDGTEVSWSDTDTASLAPGASVTLTANNGPGGFAKWTATNGTHTILAWVNDVSRFSESDTGNNQLTKNLSVGSSSNLPDFIVTGITASPASPNIGDAVTFTATVKNQGNAAGAPGTVAFSVDGTRVATSSDSTAALAADSSATLSGTSTWTATDGSHTVGATANINNSAAESNTGNNTFSTSLTVGGSGSGLPDLVVTGISSSPASPLTGNAVTFSAVIKNQGTGATPAGTVIGCQFQVDGAEVSWSDTDTAALAPGASVTLTANGGPGGAASWTATTGSHTILAWVNDVGRFSESSTSNNQLTVPLTITPMAMPDFVVSNLTASPASQQSGGSVAFTATILNQGSAAGAPGTTAFAVDGTTVCTSSNDASPLAVDGIRTVACVWTASGVGNHSVTATANSGKTTAESSQSNNTGSAAVTVTPQPGVDFIVTGIAYTPQYPAAGNSVTFSATVQNQGTVAGSAGTITFSVDGTQVSFAVSTASIAANSSLVITASGTWKATGGFHTIAAAANTTRSTAETDYGNNSCSATMAVGSGGEGATMPYTDYLAADGQYGGGAVLHTDYNFAHTTIADEATNQEYVGLPTNGSYVQWTMTTGGAGVDMRFTMPDASDGMGRTGSLDCYVNGQYVKTISLSSYWAYQYFTSGDPADAPNGGTAAFQFDEVHWVLPVALNPGDVLKIQKTNGDSFEYGVDFVEVEPVPAAVAQPANSLSVTQYGAVPNDGVDDLAAFNACVSASVAQGKTMYIPAGTFDLSNMWVIGSTSSPISNITVTGAGIWYTDLQFTSPNQGSGGISLRLTPTGKIDFSNVYMNSELRTRYNENAVYKGFMDDFGQNSTIHDVWEEHFECGFWVADYAYSPAQVATGLTIRDCRIRNNLADGVNLCNGTSNSKVVNCNVRNCGDDGLAMWANNYNGAPMEENNTFANDTVEHIWRSSGIAIYGGSGHIVRDCVVSDTFMSAGIKMNTAFSGYHFGSNSGITFQNIILRSTGTSYDCWQGEDGAVELEATTDPVSNVMFTNLNIEHSQRDAVQMGWDQGFNNIVFNNCNIDGTGEDGVTTSKYSSPHLGGWLFAFAPKGSVTFNGLTKKNIANPNGNLVRQGFTVTVS